MKTFPWEFHPDLSLDRLQLFAKVLRDTRNSTLLLYDPGNGDGRWSLGCRVHERSGNNLIRAARTMWDWLQVVSSTLDYVFRIGEVPIGFYHGDSDRPGERRLRPNLARQGNFLFGDASVDLLWWVAVETDGAGQASEVVLIGVTPNGDIECSYVIPPLDVAVVFFDPPPSHGGKTPVQLPPPRLRSRQKSDDKRKDSDDGTQPA